MKYEPQYSDGTVDIRNKAILSSDGIRQLEHPYIAYAAEKIGGIVTLSFIRLGSALHPVSVRDENGTVRSASCEVNPKTKRFIGGALMAIGVTVGVVTQADVMMDITQAGFEVVDNVLSDSMQGLARAS